VLDREQVVGIVGMTELIGGYRRALATSLRRLTQTGRTVLVEETVAEDAEVAGRTIAEVPWSPGTVVVSVQRKGQLFFASGGTRLEAGDVVTAVTHPGSESALRVRLGGGEVYAPVPTVRRTV
jgi:Trk K+ transport system NAD-binding subunit